MPGPGCLRLLLALTVMVSHLGRLECGRIAVLIFFYLSGYWVTRLWRDDFRERGVLRFYASRLARIVPLYWVVLGIVLLVRREMPSPQSLLLLGIANHGPDPIGVAWSLDIELQFYLIIPLLAAWLKPSPLLACAAALVCGAGWLIHNLVGIGSLAQYLPPFLFGAWTLECGWRPSRAAAAVSLVAFAVFIVTIASFPVSAAFLDKSRPDPFDRDIFALLAMLPLLPFVAWTLGIPSTPLDRTLGDMSYALYLVHYPIIAMFSTTKLLAVTLSFAAAIATGLLVDRPLNRWRRMPSSRKRLFCGNS